MPVEQRNVGHVICGRDRTKDVSFLLTKTTTTFITFQKSKVHCAYIYFWVNPKQSLHERLLHTHKVFTKDQCFYLDYHKFSIKSYVFGCVLESPR